MPVTNGDIRIRLSTEQRQELKRLSELRGYTTVSQYIRDKIFSDDQENGRMIKEMYEALCSQKAYKTNKESQPKK